jgi:nitroreductase
LERLGLRRRRLPPANPLERSLDSLSDDELLALMRHEAHRVEKAVYNRYLETKREDYVKKHARVGKILDLLRERGVAGDEPTVQWARRIFEGFEDLETRFVKAHSRAPEDFDRRRAEEFVELVRQRRSSRVWHEEQPSSEELEAFARVMIDAARWAPNSGNRQAWRFVILSTPERKRLMADIKEPHTVRAPLLVFVGMDRRLYGALGREERSIFIDAGAAVENMLLAAHLAGMGACWNHLARDLIDSREVNRQRYAAFCADCGVPDYVEPIGLVAIGRVAFIPPVPERMAVKSLILG